LASATFTYTILTGTISTSGSIRNWAQHAVIPVEQILEESQQWIYERLRHQSMIVAEPLLIAADAYTLTPPDDFLDPVSLTLWGDAGELDYVHENILKRYVDQDGIVQTGRPSRFSYYGDLIQFDCANDEAAGLTGELVYYQMPPLLSPSIQTNWLTDRFGGLLRQTCTAKAYEHRKRPEASGAYMLAEKAINEANIASDFMRRGMLLR